MPRLPIFSDAGDFASSEAFSRRSSVREEEVPGWAREQEGAAGAPSLGGLKGGNVPLLRNLFQRDTSSIPKAFVDAINEATSIDWKIDNAFRTDKAQGSSRRAPLLSEPIVARRKVSPKTLSGLNLFEYPIISRPRSYAADVSADRRSFNFTGFPKTIFGTLARTVVGRGDRLRFKIPSIVVPCVQRTIRREVLFAKRKVGKGGSSHKAKRMSSTSKIGC